MPGDSDPKYIIFGTESSWSNDVKLRTDINKEYCGKYSSRQSLSVAYKEYSNSNGGSVHMSMIFNIFVIYTLFNQINCRMIDDSFNILKRITRSLLFPLITLCEMALQVLIVCFGKSIFHVANNGLTGEQWGICFGFSAITFVVSIITKFLPFDRCIDDYLKIEEKKEEEDPNRVNKVPSEDSSTNPSTNKNSRKLYDQAIPIDVKRSKEAKDILKLSENSSIISREKEEF